MLIYNLYYTYKTPCSYIVTRLDYVFAFYIYIYMFRSTCCEHWLGNSLFSFRKVAFFLPLKGTGKSKVLAWGFEHFLKVDLMVNFFCQMR